MKENRKEEMEQKLTKKRERVKEKETKIERKKN